MTAEDALFELLRDPRGRARALALLEAGAAPALERALWIFAYGPPRKSAPQERPA